jgi:hypothetical protein
MLTPRRRNGTFVPTSTRFTLSGRRFDAKGAGGQARDGLVLAWGPVIVALMRMSR